MDINDKFKNVTLVVFTHLLNMITVNKDTCHYQIIVIILIMPAVSYILPYLLQYAYTLHYCKTFQVPKFDH